MPRGSKVARHVAACSLPHPHLTFTCSTMRPAETKTRAASGERQGRNRGIQRSVSAAGTGAGGWLSRLMEPRRKKTSVLDEGHPTLPQGVGGRTVLVYEDKPSTVVAYALSSKLYWLKLVDAMVAVSRHSASMQGLSTFTSDAVFGDPMHLSPSRPTVRSRSSGGTAAGDATATDMLRPTQLPHPVAPSVRTL